MLREYREVLVTDIKASIKVVVAEVLPIMWARPGNGEIIHEEGDGERGRSNLILAPYPDLLWEASCTKADGLAFEQLQKDNLHGLCRSAGSSLSLTGCHS